VEQDSFSFVRVYGDLGAAQFTTNKQVTFGEARLRAREGTRGHE